MSTSIRGTVSDAVRLAGDRLGGGHMARTPATECESSDQAQSASWRGDHEVAVGRFGRVFPTPIVQSPVSMVRCRCRSCGWLNSFTASSSDVFEWVVWQSRIVLKNERAVPAQPRPHSTTFLIPLPFLLTCHIFCSTGIGQEPHHC